MKSSHEHDRLLNQPITKRETGFAVSIFGFGITLLLTLFYFARPDPGDDSTLDGTEKFAEAIGHGFQSVVIISFGTFVMLVSGTIGLVLGSRAGKAMFVLGSVVAIGFASIFVFGVLSR